MVFDIIYVRLFRANVIWFFFSFFFKKTFVGFLDTKVYYSKNQGTIIEWTPGRISERISRTVVLLIYWP